MGSRSATHEGSWARRRGERRVRELDVRGRRARALRLGRVFGILFESVAHDTRAEVPTFLVTSTFPRWTRNFQRRDELGS